MGGLPIKPKTFVKNCKNCMKDLETNEYEKFHDFIKIKEFNNRRWLSYPTRQLFNFFVQVEHITNHILKDSANKENIGEYIKMISSIHLNFNFISCAEHKESLKKYLLSKSIIFFVHNWCKEVSNLLTGKAKLWDYEDDFKVSAFNYK